MNDLTREQIMEERRRIRLEYGKMFDSIAALLYRHDPISINLDEGAPSDEYEPEAGTILPRLRGCHSADDVLDVVHSEFVRWFGAETAGRSDFYREIAAEIWALWNKFQQSR